VTGVQTCALPISAFTSRDRMGDKTAFVGSCYLFRDPQIQRQPIEAFKPNSICARTCRSGNPLDPRCIEMRRKGCFILGIDAKTDEVQPLRRRPVNAPPAMRMAMGI